MITKEKANDVIGSTVYGSGNEKIGKVGQIFVDNETGEPQFATVQTGLFGSRESFVPLDRADAQAGELHVPHDSQEVKNAPNVGAEGRLSQQEERELYEHYGMGYPGRAPGTEQTQPETSSGGTSGTSAGAGTAAGAGAGAGAAGAAAGTGRAGRETRSEGRGEDAMTRSEERVRVDKESRETGRARLRKYVVTENVEQTVPVSHEEVRVEREPITEENRASAQQGQAFTEDEHEVTLHEERPVVSKEEVPVERVRLTKETQTEHQQVSEQVRKEQIEEDIPGEERNSRGKHSR